MLLLFYFFLLFSFYSFIYSFNYRVIKTPIFHFTSLIKQHHIVIVKPKNKRGLYAIDFTPVKQNNFKTYIYLLLGINIPAEIRVRYILNDININDDENKIQEKWNKDSIVVNPASSYYPVFELQKRKTKWREPNYMYLYKHNCQHFSNELVEIIKKMKY